VLSRPVNGLLRYLECGPAEFILLELTTGLCAHKLPFCLVVGGMIGRFSLTAGIWERQNVFTTHYSDVQASSEFAVPKALAGGFFQNPLFELFLALDAVAGPGNGLETLGIDVLAAGDALAERTFPDAG